MVDVNRVPIVIDNGSSVIKAGFAEDTDTVNVSTFPSIIGSRTNPKESFVGYEAQSKRGLLTLKYPIERGVITNWDAVEKIWDHAFRKELKADPEEHSILLTESASNRRAKRERMVEIIFEKFKSPDVAVGNQPRLAMISSGRLQGIVFESGDGVSQVGVRRDGESVQNADYSMDFAGGDLTDYLIQLISKKNPMFTVYDHRQVVEDIKTNHCYIAQDFNREKPVGKTYELPDGRRINLEEELFHCPEALFQPRLPNKSGIHKIIYESIMKCDVESRQDLFRNIVLSGGNMLYKGLVERTLKEITSLVPSSTDVRVSVAPDGQVASWIGGSIISTLSTFTSTFSVSREEYEESGSSIIHDRVF